MQKIKAVFLDAAQSLFDLKPSFAGAFAHLAQGFGYPVTERQVQATLPRIQDLYQQLAAQTNFKVSQEILLKRWEKIDRAIFEAIGIEAEVDELVREMEQRFDRGDYAELFPDAIQTLQEVREKGYRVGIISNGTKGMMDCLRHLGLDQYVEFILVSALVGWEKPSPEIFRMACERVNVNPSEALYVGDDYYTDYCGARDYGMQTLLLNRNNKPSPESCLSISTLYDVISFLESDHIQ